MNNEPITSAEYEKVVENFLTALDTYIEKYKDNVQIVQNKLNQLTYDLQNS